VRALRRVWRWLTAPLRRRAREGDLAAEFEHHLEELEGEHRRRGLAPEEARRAARLDFCREAAFAAESCDAWAGRRTSTSWVTCTRRMARGMASPEAPVG
jgi:hypothetical protein